MSFEILYDLRNSAAWKQDHEHRQLWGKSYTNVYILDSDHVLLIFWPGGPGWERWEQERRRMILESAA